MAFATVQELQARLEWTLSTTEVGVAEGALDDLTIQAKEYGRATWTDGQHPPAIKSMILSAAARFMRNYEGFSESRAGDETLGWKQGSVEPGTAEFTKGEIKRIKRIASAPAFGAITTYTWGTTPATREDLMANAKDKQWPWVSPDERDWYESW